MSKTNGNEFNAVAPILREFRLTTMLSSLEDLTAQARGESWDYPTYLQRLCEVEWCSEAFMTVEI
jgi:hypothetical protein